MRGQNVKENNETILDANVNRARTRNEIWITYCKIKINGMKMFSSAGFFF